MKVISLLMCVAGFCLAILYDIYNRDVYSPNSPKKFSLKFLILDNYRKWGISFLIAILQLFIYLESGASELLVKMAGANEPVQDILNALLPALMGLWPEHFMAILKSTKGILRPKKIKLNGQTYKRS